jgi:DNA-binding PadR family transcriptional regulator
VSLPSSTDSAPSHLGSALLGLLARSPDTGYGLTVRMRRPVGYFWTAQHSQIYPELARLEAAGLVDHEVIEGRGPRPTKRYRATEEGLAALGAFVAREAEQPVRDLETLRLWSVWTVAPEVARAVVESAHARHAATLAAYERELDSLTDLPEAKDPAHPDFASRLTLEGGVRTQRAAVEWCEWMRGELSQPE